MLQRMMGEEEEAFWCKLDLKTGEELELGVPAPDIQIENVGRQILWGLESVLAQEVPPLLGLGEEPMEVEGDTK